MLSLAGTLTYLTQCEHIKNIDEIGYSPWLALTSMVLCLITTITITALAIKKPKRTTLRLQQYEQPAQMYSVSLSDRQMYSQPNPGGEMYLQSNPGGEMYLQSNPGGEMYLQSNPGGQNIPGVSS